MADNADDLLDKPEMNLAKEVKTSLKSTILVTIYTGLVAGYTVSFLPGYLRMLNPEDQVVTFVQSLFIAMRSLGAILGGFLFGYTSTRYSIKSLIVTSNILSVVSVFLFGYANLVPTNWRFTYVILLSFASGASTGIIALIRTYASIVIEVAEVRVKFLTYISAVGGLGHLASTLIVSLGSFFKVSSSYDSHYPIFDTYTFVIYTVAILGLFVAFIAYYSILDLNEVKELQSLQKSPSENKEGRKKSLRRALSRPEIKKTFSNKVTYISWIGALIMCFIWMLDILGGQASNLSNVYSAEFNYTNKVATKFANRHIMRAGGMGLLGYASAIYCVQFVEAHYLLLGVFFGNLLNYVFLLPLFGSRHLHEQLETLDYGCVYSWCNSEKGIQRWQITIWGLLYTFMSSFIMVSVTAAHGVVVSVQGKHAIHQTLFTTFGFLGTLLNPLFVLNIFSNYGFQWLTSIEMMLLVFAIIVLIVYSVLYSFIEDDVSAQTAKDKPKEDVIQEQGL